MIASEKVDVRLEDGVEWRKPITFTPPKYGWYEIEFQLSTPEGAHLMGVGSHCGVTPRFPGMPDAPTLAAASAEKQAWPEVERSAFCGLHFLRVNSNEKPDLIEKIQNYSDAHEMTLLVQFEGVPQCERARVQEMVTALRGKVKYWEVVNEPNFTLSPEKYVELLARVSRQIKEIDPAAKVMGPDVCGMQLSWNEAFLKLGGGKYVDIYSIHDYEGNEAIDPDHWRFKLGELHKLLAKYGAADRQIWQTERAIVGTRAVFIGGVQAVRASLHRDLLDSLGISDEHNSFYYILDHGHKQCTSYLWGESGPHPAALTLRTRDAMVHGRRFAGTLDFGPSGNQIFFGLRYEGADDSTITLHQYGAVADQPLEMELKGGEAVDLVDSFGNSSQVTSKNGKLSITVGPLPIYLRLKRGQSVTPPHMDFGRNLALDATFTYSGKASRDTALINDGHFGVTHAGNRLLDKFWTGEWPKDGSADHLDIVFPSPRCIDKMLLFSMRGDNPYSCLLDFDLQADQNGNWTTIAQVRASLPPSDPVASLDSKTNTWYMDQNFHVVSFSPVVTGKLRLVCLRATRGFMADEQAVQAAGWKAGGSVQINEIELFGPPAPVSIDASFDAPLLTKACEKVSLPVTIRNRTERAFAGRISVSAPTGWKTDSVGSTFTVAPGASHSATVTLLPPPEIPAGRALITASLIDPDGKVVDYTSPRLEFLPSVSVLPKNPKVADGPSQPLAVAIANVSKHPVTGRVRVAVSSEDGAEQKPPVEEGFSLIAPGNSVTFEVAIPNLNLIGTAWHVDYSVMTEGLATTIQQKLAAIRPWNVAGPFPNENGSAYDAVYSPEKHLGAINPAEPVSLPDGQTVKWRPAMNDPRGFVDLLPLIKPNENVAAYAFIFVKSPYAQTAVLSE